MPQESKGNLFQHKYEVQRHKVSLLYADGVLNNFFSMLYIILATGNISTLNVHFRTCFYRVRRSGIQVTRQETFVPQTNSSQIG